jgi:hypothetical protein
VTTYGSIPPRTSAFVKQRTLLRRGMPKPMLKKFAKRQKK